MSMREDRRFWLPEDAEFHSGAGEVTIVTKDGEIKLMLTEEQMLQLILRIGPQAAMAEARTPQAKNLQRALLAITA